MIITSPQKQQQKRQQDHVVLYILQNKHAADHPILKQQEHQQLQLNTKHQIYVLVLEINEHTNILLHKDKPMKIQKCIVKLEIQNMNIPLK